MFEVKTLKNMINLDFTSRTPIYEQIVNEIERYVALKILKPGEQISSIREMAISLGINPNTVKKAYSLLENKKIIEMYSTKGTFIASNVDSVKEQKITEIEDKIRLLVRELEDLGCTKDKIKKDVF